MDKKKVLAIFAHPDDIEIFASGTMLLLKEKGWELHYMTLSNGDLGAIEGSREDIGRIRIAESRKAAKLLGAIYHEPFVGDMQIEHSQELISKLASIVRLVQPDIILTHPLEDYMEDHINAGRLACTAAFVRAAFPYKSDPPLPSYNKQLAIYHCNPHGLKDRMKRNVSPDFYINVESVMEKKKEAIECHKSQEVWMKSSQGNASLSGLAEENAFNVGKASGCFTYAECWTSHLHIGYCEEYYNPLHEELKEFIQDEKIRS